MHHGPGCLADLLLLLVRRLWMCHVQAGLQALADAHPDVIGYMDEGIFSRICSMNQAKVRHKHVCQ